MWNVKDNKNSFTQTCLPAGREAKKNTKAAKSLCGLLNSAPLRENKKLFK